MTPEKYRRIEAELGEAIRRSLKINVGKSNVAVSDVEEVIRKSIVPKFGDKKHSKSSACHPVASRYWVIGIFGSVWLDAEIQGRVERIAWAGGDRFVIEEFEDEPRPQDRKLQAGEER
jgi:hypothetical protein